MSDDLTSLDDFRGRARLFPLPDLVLFPNVVQPLRIFVNVPAWPGHFDIKALLKCPPRQVVLGREDGGGFRNIGLVGAWVFDSDIHRRNFLVVKCFTEYTSINCQNLTKTVPIP